MSKPPTAEELFHQARAMETEEARAAFLARTCGGNEALRAQVEDLLRAEARAGDFLKTNDRHIGSTVHGGLERPGQRIGRYKLLQLIGEGGFGSVYMAEQEEPIRRRVALKIIKPGMDSRMVAARFEAERQALALMDHPHIARVFDGGITEASLGARPFFVMEYVIGDPITAFADAHKLSIGDRLALFTQVCDAVQHAHTKGIIHRDLKPTNVLVSMIDGKPFAKVIDFGIAKATGGRLTEKTLFTEHRQLIGTPEYMSPEQAEGSPDIDTRTDVYALGVLLYELLTGTTPFDAARLRSAAFAEMQRILKEEEPPMPSVRLSRGLETLAAAAVTRRTEPARLGTLVKGELDWIVMKALDKDRARRYESPNQLAGDVQRHLAGEAVVAAPESVGYRARKWVRRNKRPVAAASALAAVLLIGIAGTAWGMQRANRESRRAEQQRDLVIGALKEVTAAIVASDPSLQQKGDSFVGIGGHRVDLAWRRDMDGTIAVELVGTNAAGDAEKPDVPCLVELLTGHAKGATADSRRLRESLIAQRDIAQEAMNKLSAILTCDICPPDQQDSHARGFKDGLLLSHPEYAQLPEAELNLRVLCAYAVSQAEQLRTQTRTSQLATATIQFDSLFADDERSQPERRKTLDEVIAVRERYLGPAHPDTLEALWTGASVFEPEEARLELFEQIVGRLESAKAHPDARLARHYGELAAAAVRLGELETARRWIGRIAGAIVPIYDAEGEGSVRSVRNNLTLVDLDDGISAMQDDPITRDMATRMAEAWPKLSDARLLEACACGLAMNPEAPDRESRCRALSDLVRAILDQSPKDPHALTALAAVQHALGESEDAMTTARRAATARAKAGLAPKPADMAIAAMSLHSLGRKQEARAEFARLKGVAPADRPDLPGVVRSMLYAAQRLIEPSAEARAAEYRESISIASMAIAGGNVARARELLDACDPELRGWEWRYLAGRSDTSARVLVDGTECVYRATLSPDGTRVVTGYRGGKREAFVWEAATGKLLATLPAEGGSNDVDYSPDGARVLVCGSGSAVVWDVAEKRPVVTLPVARSASPNGAFSSDGARILTWEWARRPQVWDARTGALITDIPLEVDGEEAKDGLGSAAFAAGGARVVTAHFDHVKVWDAATGSLLHTLACDKEQAREVKVSPDGRSIVCFGFSSQVVVGGVTNGEVRARITVNGERGLVEAAFSPDGSLIVTSGYGRGVQVWSVATGALVRELPVERAEGWHVAEFSPNATQVVVWGVGTPAVFDVATGERVRDLVGHAGDVTAAQFSPDGSSIVTASDDGASGSGKSMRGRIRTSCAPMQSL